MRRKVGNVRRRAAERGCRRGIPRRQHEQSRDEHDRRDERELGPIALGFIVSPPSFSCILPSARLLFVYRDS